MARGVVSHALVPLQRRADDGLDGQPLPDARAAHLAARVALHGDGRRRDYCAPEG